MSIKASSAVWSHSKATNGALLVILAIADHADDNGFSWPGIQTICKKTRLCKRAVNTALRDLLAAGEISRHIKASEVGTNKYRILLVDQLATTGRSETQNGAKTGTNGSAHIATVCLSDGADSATSYIDDGAHIATVDGAHIATVQNLTLAISAQSTLAKFATRTVSKPTNYGKPLKSLVPSSENSENAEPDETPENVPALQTKNPDQESAAKTVELFPTGDTTTFSGVDKSEPATQVEAKAKATDSIADEFADLWPRCPKRFGSNSRAAALKAYRARRKEGHKAETIAAGLDAYAAHIKAAGKWGTEFVKQAATFFGPALHFADEWPTNAPPASQAPQSGYAANKKQFFDKIFAHLDGSPSNAIIDLN